MRQTTQMARFVRYRAQENVGVQGKNGRLLSLGRFVSDNPNPSEVRQRSQTIRPSSAGAFANALLGRRHFRR
jgi:hypothetical protein